MFRPQPMLRPHPIMLLAVLLLPQALVAQSEHDDILVASSARGGGNLVAVVPSTARVRVFESLCAGGMCLYSSADPGFIGLTQERPADGHFVLNGNVAVRLQLVGGDAAASLKVGPTLLRSPGDHAALGNGPGLHNHPSWQLTLPQGTIGDYDVTLKLTTTARGYSESLPFALTISNAPAATASPSPTESPQPTHSASPRLTATLAFTPTATPSITATATETERPLPSPTPEPSPTIPPCAGDCNADGEVTVDELVLGVSVAIGAITVELCPSLDANGDGEVTIDELIAAVNEALLGCRPHGGFLMSRHSVSSPFRMGSVPIHSSGLVPARLAA